MKYFKNIEVSRLFGINPTTVTNYIRASIAGRNNIELFIGEDGREFIIDSEENRQIIAELTEKGRKHKSKDLLMKVTPSKEFYDTLNVDEIAEIVNIIEKERVIPHKFTFYGKGVEKWNEYTNNHIYNSETNEIPVEDAKSRLLQGLVKHILLRLPDGVKANIIDLGVGPGISTYYLVKELEEESKLGKYIISGTNESWVDANANRMKEWFPKLEIIQEYKMFERGHLASQLFKLKNVEDEPSINVALVLGNIYSASTDKTYLLKQLSSSLSGNDLLAFQDRNPQAVQSSSFIRTAQRDLIKEIYTYIPSLLGIEVKKCRFKASFNPDTGRRQIFLIVDKDYEIDIELENIKTQLKLFKGDAIELYDVNIDTIEQMVKRLDDVNLNLVYLNTSVTDDTFVFGCEAKKVKKIADSNA